MAEQLYKVLVNGKSCHTGDMTWSLPTNGQPGEWMRVEGRLKKCEAGLHLTDDPAQWWKPGCAVYLVETEGVIGSCEDDADRKVVCRAARIMREATADELTSLRIFTSGKHEAKAGKVIASDSASVWASGSASVWASGSASVWAYDSASVRAYDSASVRAYDSASVEAYDSASVEASASASVRAYGSASVRAYGSALVEASGSASVRAYGSASVRAYGSASVRAYGSALVRAYGSALVEGTDSVTVVSWWGKPGVRIDKRAIWIERGDGETAPVVHAAKEPDRA